MSALVFKVTRKVKSLTANTNHLGLTLTLIKLENFDFNFVSNGLVCLPTGPGDERSSLDRWDGVGGLQ